MNEVDIAAMKTMAQGDGTMLISKALMRALLQQHAAMMAGRRVPASSGRIGGTASA